MQLIAAETGWALERGRLFWTNNDGAHWADITPHASGVMADVFFLDRSRGWALFSDSNDAAELISFHVAATTDSGRTWTVSTIKVPSQKPEELDGHAWLDFVDPDHGWVVLHANSSSAFSWGLLLSTVDGGTTWNELPKGAPIAGRPVFVAPRDGWLSGNSGPKGMFRTHNGGNSWIEDGPAVDKLPPILPTNPGYGDVKFIDVKHGHVLIYLSPANDAEESKGTAMLLYATSDGGKTWVVDRTLTDHGAFSKSGAALSRLGASAILSGGTGTDSL